MSATFTTLLTAAPEPSKIIEFSMVTVWDWAIQVFALLFIIWILSKILFKPVTEFLEKRKAMIAGEINEATTAKNDAAALKVQYQEKIAHIEDEANAILKEARAKALVREEQIIAAAKEEADTIKVKAMQDIKLEEERVKAQMKEEMIEVASLMASKFVSTSMDESKQHQLIDEIITEMGDVQWLN
ncbi:MAG: F0F1 ATP synthase subunit B [Cellulosilyticaceae bacterium]